MKLYELASILRPMECATAKAYWHAHKGELDNPKNATLASLRAAYAASDGVPREHFDWVWEGRLSLREPA